MYFKKQIYFASFMAIILLIGLYKQNKMKSIIDDVELVNVEIINTDCSRITSLSKNDYSFFEFKFNNKIYRQRLSAPKCHNLSKNTNLYYYSNTEEFFLPELIKEGYYKTSIYFLGAILLIALIPYKLFLK